MNKIQLFLRRALYKIQDLFPTPLPKGLTAYYKWCDRLLFTYFPEDASPPSLDSFQFSIAAMVMHIDSQKASVPNRYFGNAIRKGAANEVASYVMHDLKAKRDALIKAQEDAQASKAQKTLAEVTALAIGSSDGPQGV